MKTLIRILMMLAILASAIGAKKTYPQPADTFLYGEHCGEAYYGVMTEIEKHVFKIATYDSNWKFLEVNIGCQDNYNPDPGKFKVSLEQAKQALEYHSFKDNYMREEWIRESDWKCITVYNKDTDYDEVAIYYVPTDDEFCVAHSTLVSVCIIAKLKNSNDYKLAFAAIGMYAGKVKFEPLMFYPDLDNTVGIQRLQQQLYREVTK